ncbi:MULTISPECIES: hypothetical protein [Flavobacterium]|uniref:Uncharacterized protein n=1 Tax=Flavobacterium hankyongi TaxID=1176532 RepID=A0ABP8ZN54_9FLAO|nr:hypothetical protein [Flavobacterium sp. N1846]
MNNKILLLFFLITFKIFSQRKEVKYISYNQKKIPISRIDYSNYGVMNFFITVSEEDNNNKIEENGRACLKYEDRLYHTLYFFVKIPKGFSLIEKEDFLAQLVQKIDSEEKIKDVYYYINLDSNFTKKLIEVKSGLDPNKFRAFIDINSENICKALHIR